MIAAQTARAEPRAEGASLYSLYLMSVAACLVGNVLIRMGERGGWLPRWGQVTLAVLAAAPLAVAAVLFWKLLRQELDEMLQRIVLEGLAMALIVYIPIAGLYVNLRTAAAWVPRLDPPDILLGPAVLVAIGIAVARRRYL